MLSYDGVRGSVDHTQKNPKHLFDEHILIKSGRSSFSSVLGKRENITVFESLYIKK